MLFLRIPGHNWCLVVTSEMLSTNHNNFEEEKNRNNPPKIQKISKNPKKISKLRKKKKI